MPSKTGLQKNLRRYGLFLIIGLCITALIWGTMSAQLNTRALSFNEDAARVRLILDQPDGLHLQTGSSYWLMERRYAQWGAGFRQLLKYHYGLYDRKGSGCGLLQLLDSPK